MSHASGRRYSARRRILKEGANAVYNKIVTMSRWLAPSTYHAHDPRNFCRPTGRHARAEILDKFFLHTPPKAAPAPLSNHMTYITFVCNLCQPLFLSGFGSRSYREFGNMPPRRIAAELKNHVDRGSHVSQNIVTLER